MLNAGLNLGLSLWWVKPFGLYGVAFGTAVPLALVGGIGTMVYACYALRLGIGRYLWLAIARPGLASLGFVIPALIGQNIGAKLQGPARGRHRDVLADLRGHRLALGGDAERTGALGTHGARPAGTSRRRSR